MTQDTLTQRDPLKVLEKHFGFRKFLEGQGQVISALLAGQDALVVMPTGGGKSLCYQLPALIQEGVTLVVSPLIALMKDQVDGLVRKGIAAVAMNSTLSWEEQKKCLAAIRSGKVQLVYVAPERFRSQSFMRALEGISVSLLAVDEAHCISQWGHDFRPDYLKLKKVIDALGKPQIAAFTATATPQVKEDILQQLGLTDAFHYVGGFARPNLSLNVFPVENAEEKFRQLQHVIDTHRYGIIYCSTRKHVEKVTQTLKTWGISLIAYHGGMEDGEREKAQNLFLEGKRDVAVATNAFGMGIDRPDVRFVAHFDIPGSLEAYYQEAGRAGRDGEPAHCTLLFNFADTRTQEFFIDGANPSFSLIGEVYRFLCLQADTNHVVTLPIKEIARQVEAKNDMAVSSALAVLSRGGYLERFDIPGSRMRGTRLLYPEINVSQLEIDREALRTKEQLDREKLQTMINFTSIDQCRQQWILEYFGEKESEECGSCDNCSRENTEDFREPNERERVLVQKALSGVARLSYKTKKGWEGRFGRGKIIQVLVGSRSQEVLNYQFDQLSVYGILKTEGTSYLHTLFKKMQTIGLLQVSAGNYPVVTLTQKGEEVMQNKIDYKMSWPQAGSPKKRQLKEKRALEETVIRELGFDEILFKKLKTKRTEIAQRHHNLPPYRIFPNATLEFFTRLKPTTIQKGLKIRGVGEAKAQKYLPEFIAVIKEHTQS